MGCRPMVYSPTPIEEYLQRLDQKQQNHFQDLFSSNRQNDEWSQLALKFFYNKMILDFCYTYDQQNQQYLENLRISFTYDLLNYKNFLRKPNEFWTNFLQNQAEIITQMYDQPLQQITIIEQTEQDIKQIRKAEKLIKFFRQDIYYYFINFNNDQLKEMIASFHW